MHKTGTDDLTLLANLLTIRHDVLSEIRASLANWLPGYTGHELRYSAANLAAYLALQRFNSTELSGRLNSRGLTALGQCSLSVMAELDAVIAALAAITGSIEIRRRSASFNTRAYKLLEKNTIAVFGSRPKAHRRYIMVTLSNRAAEDYYYVRSLVSLGMSVARINCAYDTAEVWAAMIANVRRAESELGISCRVLMDLAGSKARISAVVYTTEKGRLKQGDKVLLAKYLPRNASFNITATCSLPQYIDCLSIGDSVIIDEGKIEAVVSNISPEGAVIEIIKTNPKGCRLKPNKGLNFPGKAFVAASLTAKDCGDLEFILAKADMVGSSFIRTDDDIDRLQHEMVKSYYNLGSTIPIIAKIETVEAIENLPKIICRIAQKQPVGIMIARGDLAIEIGYERLAKEQERILHVAKAAHVPVVWATQVLDNLVKYGIPARAELTDAARADNAECIMLNKGAFVQEAISFLSKWSE